MLWVDKHRPTSLSKLDYHLSMASNLVEMAKDGELPHIMFYGPAGSGKKTRIMALLRAVFGPGVEKLRLEQRTFKTKSNTKVEINTVASNFHIELNPGDAGNHDCFVVQEFIKEVAAHSTLDASSDSNKKKFKVILLSEVDRLSRKAQAALRRTMEKYTGSCRLILCCRNPSKVIPPVRSRCLGVRVASPTSQEIVSVLQTICKKEGIKIPDELASRIAIDSSGNLRRAIFALEACRVQSFPLSSGQLIQRPQWELFIEKLAQEICKDQSPKKLLEARSMVYELMVNCIPPSLILKTLVKSLTKHLDDELKFEVTKWAAFYEHRMQLGNKQIFHIEAFIAKFMSLYKTFLCMMAF